MTDSERAENFTFDLTLAMTLTLISKGFLIFNPGRNVSVDDLFMAIK